MRRPILTKDDPIVRQIAKPVDQSFVQSAACATLIGDMVETMRAAHGIGLAAPQIGESIRAVVIAFQDGALFLANPEIVKPSLRKVTEEEGCLSVPGVYGKVRRHQQLTVKYLDAEGKPQERRATGLFARVVQHEVDHLNGKLFIDRTKNFTRGRP